MIQWEIVTTNTCNVADCKVADKVAFKDYYNSEYLKYTSSFAQLKNLDGTNVNANPIAFTPTFSNENGNTVLSVLDLTDIVGNVSGGQYIVVTIYTTALKANSSCINNTVTISGPANSVSAQACVNVTNPKVTVVTNIVNRKDPLPNTDLNDLVSMVATAPISIKVALSILVLSLILGSTLPSVLLVKSQRD
jgi:hypothetical protein